MGSRLVLRTSLPEQTLADADVVLRYKGLEDVERFFRAMNGDLDVRPIRHRLADRVRAHVFLRWAGCPQGHGRRWVRQSRPQCEVMS